MRQSIKTLFILAAVGSSLTGCSTWMPQSSMNSSSHHMEVTDNPSDGHMGMMSGDPVENTRAIGGSIASSMDTRDYNRLSKGLDNALGKTSSWTNNQTGVKYTVTPTRKTTISGNPFCRSYDLTAVKGGGTQRMDGTACLGSDGAWHPVGS